MTKIITRYFDDAARAKAVRYELIQRQRFSPRIMDFFDKADGLAEALTAKHVDPRTAAAYEEHMANGGAVMLVRAGYKPLNVARTTREVATRMGAADLGNLVEEVAVKERVQSGLSILSDHPHMLTRPRDPSSTNYHMADWPLPLISRRKPSKAQAIMRNTHFADFPIPLTDRRKPFTGSIFGRHARMANFPIPLISRRKPFTGSIFGRHARMANFPIPLISRRKPSRRALMPKGNRMASWPFPLLMSGKTGQNALIPGGPRMANFPISLLSKREPFTGSVIPRHARMAKFPIPLISKRKPFTGSVIKRHGRMAAFPMPLLVERDGPDGFSFSRMLGMKTVIRR